MAKKDKEKQPCDAEQAQEAKSFEFEGDEEEQAAHAAEATIP